MERILFLQQAGYLPRMVSGANVSLHALCKRLSDRGHEPVVASTPVPPSAQPIEQTAAMTPAYPVVESYDPVAELPGLLRRFGPTAVVVRAPEPGERVAQAAATFDQRLHIYFESGFFSRAFPAPAAAPNLHYGANSPFLARMGQAYFATPIPMVPPVIEPEDYRCTPKGESIVFVNPIAIKGVHIAAAIAARLPHRHFLFVRSWPDHPNFRHFQPPLANIEWVSTMHDMRPLFERTKLLLMPSVWEESSGRALGEAQVSGIPTVASDRGGLTDAVGPGGVTLSLGDPIERWCAAIERIYTEHAHFAALAAGARAHAARPNYQPEAVVPQFLEFVAS